MKAHEAFRRQPKSFWAHVRTISQEVGYSVRNQDNVKVPTFGEMRNAFVSLSLDPSSLASVSDEPTPLGRTLGDYFSFRAQLLNDEAKRNLMNAEQAKALFEEVREGTSYLCPLPMNKQKGIMANHAYLTGLVNMVIEANIGGCPCEFDPRSLTTVTLGGAPLRTLSRRVDGAFPSSVNPIAIWEVKEYYYTTTFGSRIADGVYETLLDGMELEELQQSEGVEVKHHLMIDGFQTWWNQGKSYLCRIVDMMHMGYVDEVFVGREVVSSLPSVVQSWAASSRR